MGYRFSTAVTAIPTGTVPDWEAARHAIDTVELRTLWGTGADLYPWEHWLEDFDPPPDPAGVYYGIDAARDSLEHDLALIRNAFEAGPGPELLLVETPDHLLYVTGGETVGDEPSSLWTPLAETGEAGALDGGGFSRWERFAESPIGERSDGVRGAGRVRAAAARALLHVVDDVAAREGGPGPDEAPGWWAARIERALRVAEVRLGAAALLALAAELFDLAHRLHPNGPALAIVDVLADLACAEARPLQVRRRAGELRAQWTRELERLFAVDQGPLGPLLPSVLLALGAMHPDGVAHLRARRDGRPWPDAERPTGDERLDDFVEWWQLRAGAEIDWDAARAAAGGDERLQEAVERVRDGVEAECHRLVEVVELPDATVWFTGGTHRPDWDVVTHARRAREAGLLEAAGLVVRTHAGRPTQPA